MPRVFITKSNAKGKRFAAIVELDQGGTRIVNFGSATGSTYVDHGNNEKKRNWIARHSKLNEDWTRAGYTKPAFWSRWLLWNSSNINSAARYITHRFGIEIVFAGIFDKAQEKALKMTSDGLDQYI